VRNSAYRSQVRNTKSLLSWKITRSVVLLSSSRATLGQRKSLINSITQISKHQFSGKTTQTHYNGKKNSTHQGGGLTPRMVWAAGLFPGSFPDVRLRRTRMPVERTSPSTRLGERLERPADVPLGDGDSDRDVARLRSDWLSSRSYDDSVGTTPLPADGPGSRPRLGGPIVRHSSCCLRRRPRRQPTYLGSRSRPAGRRSTLRSPGNSEQEPQFQADSGGSTHDAKLHFAKQSHLVSALSLIPHTVEPYLNSPNTCGGYTHTHCS